MQSQPSAQHSQASEGSNLLTTLPSIFLGRDSHRPNKNIQKKCKQIKKLTVSSF